MANLDSAFNPRQLKNISVIFNKAGAGATEFRKCVQSFQFTPQTSVVQTQGGTPDAIFTDVVVTGWQLAVKYLQDAETLASLTDYLITNAGKTVTVDFVPYGGTGWNATVILPPAPIGGDVLTWLADTVTMGVKGAPARTVDDATTPQQ